MQQSIESFMAENLQPFRPVAYFDERLDCIRVELADCTKVDEQVSHCLTLRTRRDANGGVEHVGFSIEGATELFTELGTVALVDLLNKVLHR